MTMKPNNKTTSMDKVKEILSKGMVVAYFKSTYRNMYTVEIRRPLNLSDKDKKLIIDRIRKDFRPGWNVPASYKKERGFVAVELVEGGMLKYTKCSKIKSSVEQFTNIEVHLEDKEITYVRSIGHLGGYSLKFGSEITFVYCRDLIYDRQIDEQVRNKISDSSKAKLQELASKLKTDITSIEYCGGKPTINGNTLAINCSYTISKTENSVARFLINSTKE
ncbi:MAG: hypothetical protein N3E37_05005 [Candidatus Micrarchaeota archaeon]|nr:hypothetical protein [Candidatus Micrarchaeota archaeon]